MSDLAIEFRVKNGRLKRAILATGAKSYAEFCRRNHFRQTDISALLSMRKAAFSKQAGDWSPLAYSVSSAVHMEPEDLWPAEMRSATLSSNSGEFALTLDEAARLTAPRINQRALQTLTKFLPLNEMKAVTAMARGETLDETGKGLGQFGGDVTRERARQLALKGIRRMRQVAARNNIEFTDIVGPSK